MNTPPTPLTYRKCIIRATPPLGWSDGRNHYMKMPSWNFWVNTSTGQKFRRVMRNGVWHMVTI